MKPSISILLVAALAAGIPVIAQAQDSSQANNVPVIKANARDVVVDVVVTKGGGPVVGLKKDDFKIEEDGKPQALDFFEEHANKTALAGPPPAMPAMPPGVYTNVPPAPGDDAVNVLLLDFLNSEVQDQSYVREQVLNFLKKMQPGTRAAIFAMSSKLQFVQGFTADTGELAKALTASGATPVKVATYQSRSDIKIDQDSLSMQEAISESPAGGGPMSGASLGIEAIRSALSDAQTFDYANRAEMTMEALRHMAEYLRGVPGRKNLLWFSSEYPVIVFPSPEQRLALAQIRIGTFEIKHTADLLTAARVSLYPINAQGLMQDHVAMADNAAPGGGSQMQRMNTDLNGPYQAESTARADTTYSMRELAKDTGGKAFLNTNDLNGAMQKAISDGSHYYTLTYSPTNKKMDGKFRKIEIKTSGGKYDLSYRRGYNADKPADEGAEQDGNPLRPLLKLGLPNETEILYGVRVEPLTPQPAPGSAKAGFNSDLKGPTIRYVIDFMVRWTDVKLSPETNGAVRGKIEAGLLAYDKTGKAVNWEGGTQEMNIQPDTLEAIKRSGIPVHMELDLPADQRIVLKTGIYDWETGHTGTLGIPVEVHSQAMAGK